MGAKTRLLDSINRIFQTHIFKDLESRNCAEIKIKDLESKDYGEGKGKIQIKDLESKDFSLGEIESKHNSAKQSDKINKKNFSENSEITKDSNEGKKCETTRDSNESKTCKDSKNFKLIESGEFRATKNESESCKDSKLIESSQAIESKLIESSQTLDSKTESNQAKKDSKAESANTKKDSNPLSFFDVFAGSGVVSAEMLQNKHIDRIYMNDFLHSNYAIYQGFFTQSPFDSKKLESILCEYNNLDSKNIESNYYEKHFGTSFFSLNDARKIGYIRDDLDKKLESKMINQKEFYILLTSLLYSSDRVANTVGHYDAFRKNVALKDCFTFKLIKPLKTDKGLEIFKIKSKIKT